MNIYNNTPFKHQVTNLKKKKKKGEILAVVDLGWATLGEDKSKLKEDKEREKKTCNELETDGDKAWGRWWDRVMAAVSDSGQSLRLSPWVRISERGRKGWAPIREW